MLIILVALRKLERVPAPFTSFEVNLIMRKQYLTTVVKISTVSKKLTAILITQYPTTAVKTWRVCLHHKKVTAALTVYLHYKKLTVTLALNHWKDFKNLVILESLLKDENRSTSGLSPHSLSEDFTTRLFPPTSVPEM